ncbi:MAG: tetratricopeptide repeat protein [Methylococcales bacterium]
MTGDRLVLIIAAGLLYSSSFLVKGDGGLLDPWKQSLNLEHRGEFVKAAAVIEPLLNQGEYREYALLRYAWLAYQQRNYNDSIRYYGQALKLNPASIDARFGLTLPLLAQSDWKKAKTYLHQITAVSPSNYTAHIRLFSCEEGLRQWKQLATHAEAFSRLYPTDIATLVYLARAKHNLDDKVAAEAVYQQIQIRMPGHVEALNYIRTFQNIQRIYSLQNP